MQPKKNSILISLIHYPVYVLGPHERIVVWTQGCSIRCRGCISFHTWEFDQNKAMQIEDLALIIKQFPCKRLTISGGEPFDQPAPLLEFLKAIRKDFDDILIYSGYTIEKLQKKYLEHLSLIDALIDGPFIDGLESEWSYKGSENQRIFVFSEDLKDDYDRWIQSKKNKTLQVIQKHEGIYIIGIPYQKDSEVIKNELLQSLSNL